MTALTDTIDPDETVVAEIGISKRAILVEWLFLPALFLFFFLTVCLPVILQTLVNKAARAAFAAAIGVEDVGFFDVASNLWTAVSPWIPRWIFITAQVLLWLTVAVWVAVALVRTFRHFGYKILLTDKRVFARARSERFECEWKDLVNVFTERSVWGKLFRYGNVVLQGPRGSVTVRHVAHPEIVWENFTTYTDNY